MYEADKRRMESIIEEQDVERESRTMQEEKRKLVESTKKIKKEMHEYEKLMVKSCEKLV